MKGGGGHFQWKTTEFIISTSVSVIVSADPLKRIDMIRHKRGNLTLENRWIAFHDEHIVDLDLVVLSHDWISN